MQEAEVSLRVALYYITNYLTKNDVKVSLDGAHIKTGDTIHFDIYGFLSANSCRKVSGAVDSWQGIYEVVGYDSKIAISSTPGIGDVNITATDGTLLYVESKKGKGKNKSNSEYPLMREAIGQLMTGCQLSDNVIPVVAVPYSDKSYELACRWSQLKQIQMVGIRFMLVCADGDLKII